MIEQKEPDGEFVAEWQSHAGTQWFVQNLQIEAAGALLALIGSARYSTDPKVTAAVTYYDTLNKTLKTLTIKPQERGDDEDQPIDETER